MCLVSPESTNLSCALADQGIKIRIRKDVRIRKRNLDPAWFQPLPPEQQPYGHPEEVGSDGSDGEDGAGGSGSKRGAGGIGREGKRQRVGEVGGVSVPGGVGGGLSATATTVPGGHGSWSIDPSLTTQAPPPPRPPSLLGRRILRRCTRP